MEPHPYTIRIADDILDDLRVRLPRVKTLEEFDFAQAPHVSAVQVQGLAEGGISTAPSRWSS